MLNERRMKMKKNFLSIAFMAVFMLMATNSRRNHGPTYLIRTTFQK